MATKQTDEIEIKNDDRKPFLHLSIRPAEQPIVTEEDSVPEPVYTKFVNEVANEQKDESEHFLAQAVKKMKPLALEWEGWKETTNQVCQEEENLKEGWKENLKLACQEDKDEKEEENSRMGQWGNTTLVFPGQQRNEAAEEPEERKKEKENLE